MTRCECEAVVAKSNWRVHLSEWFFCERNAYIELMLLIPAMKERFPTAEDYDFAPNRVKIEKALLSKFSKDEQDLFSETEQLKGAHNKSPEAVKKMEERNALKGRLSYKRDKLRDLLYGKAEKQTAKKGPSVETSAEELDEEGRRVRRGRRRRGRRRRRRCRRAASLDPKAKGSMRFVYPRWTYTKQQAETKASVETDHRRS